MSRFEITSAIKAAEKKATFTTAAGETIKTQILTVGMTFSRFDYSDSIYNERLKVTVYIEKTDATNAPTLRDRIYKSTILRLSAIAEKDSTPNDWSRTREPYEILAYDADNGWITPAERRETKMILEHIISHYGRNK